MDNPFEALIPAPSKEPTGATDNPFAALLPQTDGPETAGVPLPPARPAVALASEVGIAGIPLPPARPTEPVSSPVPAPSAAPTVASVPPALDPNLSPDNPSLLTDPGLGARGRAGGRVLDAIVGRAGVLSPDERAKEHADRLAEAQAKVDTAKKNLEAIEDLASRRAPTNSVEAAMQGFDKRLNQGDVPQARKELADALTEQRKAIMTPPPELNWLRDKVERFPGKIADQAIDTVAGAYRMSPGYLGDMAVRKGVELVTGEKQDGPDITDAAKKAKNAVSLLFNAGDGRAEEFGSKIVDGVASTAGFMSAGAAGGAMRLSKAATTAIAGALPQAESMFQDATDSLRKAKYEEIGRRFDRRQAVETMESETPDGGRRAPREPGDPDISAISEWRRWSAFTLGLGIGATEAIPISHLFERLENATGGGLKRLVGIMTAQGGEEALQEGMQSLLENAAARGLYDPSREITKDVGESMLVGALTGAGMGGALGARHAFKGASSERAQRQLDTLPAAPDVAPPDVPGPPDQSTPPITPPGGIKELPLEEVPPGDRSDAARSSDPAIAQSQPASEPAASVVPGPDAGPASEAATAEPGERVPGAEPQEGAGRPLVDDPGTRVLLGAGYAPDQIADMGKRERARAVKEAEASGVEPFKGELPQASTETAAIDNPIGESDNPFAALLPAAAAPTAATDEASKVADDTGLNVPETRETLDAQRAQLEAGERSAVMYPEGTQAPPVTPGMERVETPRGTFDFDPAKISAERVREASAAGRENEILGLGPYNKADVAAIAAKTGEQPVTVTERTPNGTEVRAALGVPSSAEEQASAFEAGKTPGNTVQVERVGETLARRAPAREKRLPGPQSLFQFLAAQGGIKPTPDLLSMGLGRAFVPGKGRLLRKGGMDPDTARAAAVEAGYLQDTAWSDGPSSSTINDLYDAMDREARGQKVYTPEDAADALERQEAAAQKDPNYRDRARAHTRDQIEQHLAESGFSEVSLDDEALDRAADLVLAGTEDLANAYERAIMQLVDESDEASASVHDEVADIPWDDVGAYEGPAPEGLNDETAARADAGPAQEDREDPPSRSSEEPDAGKARADEEVGERPVALRADERGTSPRDEVARRAEEAGADGKPQTVIPGAEKVGDGELAQRKADAGLKPKQPQKDTDGLALFGDARKQDDLLDQKKTAETRETDKAAATHADLLTADRAVWEGAIFHAMNERWGRGGTVTFSTQTRVTHVSAGSKSAFKFERGRIWYREGHRQNKPVWIEVGPIGQPIDSLAKGLDLPTSYDRSKAGAEAAARAVPLDEHFAGELRMGEGFPNILAARRFAKEATGETDPKKVEEAIELGAVRAARGMIEQGWGFPELVRLYERMPTLGTRTSTSMRDQAFSTPIPLAYVASRLAGIGPDTTVYEPSAGNGALLIEAATEKTIANEINKARREALRDQEFAVLGRDASEAGAASEAVRENGGAKFDRVIANPPFGTVKDDGETRRYDLSDLQKGYATGEIDHTIALRALEAMKDNGRAVLIIGAPNAQKDRSAGYNGKAKREFFLTLYGQYNVVDHFTVSGDLYKKQGAGWPVDVVVIDGRGKSDRKVPAADVPPVLSSWDEVGSKLDGLSARSSRSAGEAPERAGSPRPSPVDGGDRGDARGGRAAEPRSGPVEPRGVREKRADGEPRPAARPVEQRADGGRPAGTDRPDQPPARLGPRVETTETATQATYTPASKKAPSLGTLVPVNMRSSVEEALRNVGGRRGDLDTFVAKKLGYSPDQLSSYFGAEQIDALALAFDNIERGAGFVIGDQTGIGKGRVNAAIIRYAIKNDLTPIFVTEKPNLYADMYRDLSDIGIQDMLGREPALLATNADLNFALDDGGKVTLRTPGTTKHNEELRDLAAAGSIGGYDAVFTTYNQMQTLKGEETERQRFLRSIIGNAVLVLDESHNAGGSSAAQRGANRQKKAAAYAKALAKAHETGAAAPSPPSLDTPDRAELARTLVDKAKAAFYSSATWAKRPEVMDLYRKTDMRLAVEDPEKLGETIEAGGVPMQQVVSSMLAKAGQYIRRERSFHGVQYDPIVTPVSKVVYDDFARALRLIQDFSLVVKDASKEIGDGLKAEGLTVGADNAVSTGGADSVNFTAIMHNIINQMLLSINARPAAEEAITALRRGEKPVIALAMTNESFLGEYAADTGLASGDEVSLDFTGLLDRYLERTRTISIRRPFMEAGEKAEKHYLTDSEIGSAGVAAFKRAKEFLRKTDFSALPVSPIDAIKGDIQAAGYKVGEITGRTMTVQYGHGGAPTVLASRKGSERSIAGRRKTIDAFNNGGLDAIILNQAGATGLSLHASERFPDQRQRHMVIAQAEGNVDTHMQMLGRVHRTGQVVPPRYTQLIPDIPAAKRPAAVLAKKMASLNANTTASRKGALTAENVPDFMNLYGDMVARRVMQDDPETNERLDYPVPVEDKDARSLEGSMRKVTGRIPLLPLNEQERLYGRLEGEYRRLLEQLDAMGENALEAKTLELDAKPVRTTETMAGEGESPFTEGVRLTEYDVKRQGKPYTVDELIADIESGLHKNPGGLGRRADEVLMFAAKAGAKMMETTRRDALSSFAGFERRFLDRIKDATKLEDARKRLVAQREAFEALTKVVYPGARLRLIGKDGEATTGVVTKISRPGEGVANPIASSQWTARIAVPTGFRSIEYSFADLTVEAPKDGDTSATKVEPVQSWAESPAHTVEAFERAAKADLRETRVIAEGNLLKAFATVAKAGQIIQFRDAEGAIRPGIMMRGKIKSIGDAMASNTRPLNASEAAKTIAESDGTPFTTEDGNLTLTNSGRGYVMLTTPKAKEKGGRFYLDQGVLSAVGKDFVSRGANMRADVSTTRLPAVVDALVKAGAKFRGSAEFDESTIRDVRQGTRYSVGERAPSPQEKIAIARARRGIDQAIQTKGRSANVVARPDLGPVTVDWGSAGDPARSFKGGYGLAHILARRQAEGEDAERFVRETLPDVLVRGEVSRRYGPPQGERVDLRLGGAMATLSLYRDRQRETWLLTAFNVAGEVGSGDPPGFVPGDDLRSQDPPGTRVTEGAEPDEENSGRDRKFKIRTDAPAEYRAATEAVVGIIRRVAGPGVQIQGAPVITAEGAGVRASGAADESQRQVAGYYDSLNNIIAVSLDPRFNAEDTAHHEAFHALQAMGVISPREKAVLDAERGRLRAYVGENWSLDPDALAAMPDYEVEAYAYGTFATAREANRPDAGKGLALAIRRAFERIRETFQRIRNALRGLGFQRAEDIFELARTGALKDRAGAPAAGQGVRYDAGHPRRSEGDAAEGFEAPGKPGFADRARRLQQDRFLPLRRIQEAIEKSGDPIPQSLDTYLAVDLFTGKRDARLEDYHAAMRDPLVEAMKSSGVTPAELGSYLYARHAPERNAIMQLRDPERFAEGGGSGMTDEVATSILDALEADGKTGALQDLAAQVDKIVAFTRDTLVEGGVLSEEQAETWERQYQHYVPLKGFAEIDPDEEVRTIRLGRGFDQKGKAAVEALGRMSVADNPLFQVLQAGDEAIVRAEKNRVAKTLARMAQANPNEAVWQVDVPKKRKVLDRQTGLVKWVADGREREDEIVAKFGGKDRRVRLADQDLANAFRNIGNAQAIPYLTEFNRIFSQLQTSRNPEFFTANAVRDVQEAAIYLAGEERGLVAPFLKTWPRALVAAARYAMGRSAGKEWDATIEEWRHGGGQITFNAFRSADEHRKSIEKELRLWNENPAKAVPRKLFRAVIKFVDGMNETFENATRLAVFKAGRSKGYTQDRAGSLAREATVNFNRRGAWSPVLNGLYVFYNAAVQGNVKAIELYMRSKHARMAFNAVIPMAIGLTLMNRALVGGGDDDDPQRNLYDDIPEWERKSNFIFAYGRTKDPGSGKWRANYLKIPAAFGLKIPLAIGEQLAQVYARATTPKKAAWWVFEATADAFNPLGSGSLLAQVTPTVGKPITEILTNMNFTKRPIAPGKEPWNEGVPRSDQAWSSTNPVAVAVAQGINKASGGGRYQAGAVDLYPQWVEYGFGWATGGAGRFVGNAFQTGRDAWDGVPTPPEKMPIVRRFMGETTGAAVSAAYREAEQEAKEGANRLNYAKRAVLRNPDDKEALAALERESLATGIKVTSKRNDRTDAITAPFTEAGKAIKSLREEQQSLRTNDGLTPRERYDKNAAIDAQVERLMSSARRQARERRDALYEAARQRVPAH